MDTTGIVIRPTEPHEGRAATRAIFPALLESPPDDERWAVIETRDDPARSFSAWDGTDCVGHAAHFPLETAIPGGARLSTGAVARVGVLPTHRRRGVASGLMRALIDDAVAAGFALLSLRASEAPIYGRYGFGLAGDVLRVEVSSARARPLRVPDIGGRFRILGADEIRSTIQPIQEAALGRRPGEITRPDLFWQRMYEDAIEGRNGRFVVAHFPDGSDRADGYVHYRVRWDEDLPDMGGVGDLDDLIGLDDGVELALWRYLLDVDLVRTWRAVARPVDDPVVEALADRRAYRVTGRADEQWLRLIDVDRALRARAWNPVRSSLTLAVTDHLVPANDGTWRIDADGAARETGGEPADLETDVTTLGAAFLGGTSWRSLAAVGRIRERRSGSVARADDLFASRPLPFCGTFF